MGNETGREMTLEEVVMSLPTNHRAKREYLGVCEKAGMFEESERQEEVSRNTSVENYSKYMRTGKALTQELDALKGNTHLKWLEENDCDLRCIDEPTGGDDSDVAWKVIEHHMAEPQEREIGYGKTPIEAIEAAMKAPF